MTTDQFIYRASPYEFDSTSPGGSVVITIPVQTVTYGRVVCVQPAPTVVLRR